MSHRKQKNWQKRLHWPVLPFCLFLSFLCDILSSHPVADPCTNIENKILKIGLNVRTHNIPDSRLEREKKGSDLGISSFPIWHQPSTPLSHPTQTNARIGHLINSDIVHAANNKPEPLAVARWGKWDRVQIGYMVKFAVFWPDVYSSSPCHNMGPI